MGRRVYLVLPWSTILGHSAHQTPAADVPTLRLATWESEMTVPLGDVLYSEVLKTIEHHLLAPD